MCFWLFVNAEKYLFSVLACMWCNFIRWNIIIFSSTQKIGSMRWVLFCIWCAVNYSTVIMARFHFRRGMFNGSHESMNVFKLSNTSTDNFQFEWHAAEIQAEHSKKYDFVMKMYLHKSLAIPMLLLLFSYFFFISFLFSFAL